MYWIRETCKECGRTFRYPNDKPGTVCPLCHPEQNKRNKKKVVKGWDGRSYNGKGERLIKDDPRG